MTRVFTMMVATPGREVSQSDTIKFAACYYKMVLVPVHPLSCWFIRLGTSAFGPHPYFAESLSSRIGVQHP